MLLSCCTQYASKFGKPQQRPQDWKQSIFIQSQSFPVFIHPIPKKGNAKECTTYHTMAIISHASKGMLKILQYRLLQYINQELPDVQLGFRKDRGIKGQIANNHWKDWCWNWSSNTLANWCEEPAHQKRLWWWERLKAGEGDNRGWNGWMNSPTQWTWVWASSRRWWRTGKTGFLQSSCKELDMTEWLNNNSLTEGKGKARFTKENKSIDCGPENFCLMSITHIFGFVGNLVMWAIKLFCYQTL